MFDDFLGDIAELYDDVDGFFTDLTGGDSILDVAKTGVNAFYGLDSGKATTTKPTLDLGSDEMVTTEPQGVMSDVAKVLGELKPIESEDPAKVSGQWYDMIRSVAVGEPYAR